MKWKLTVLIFCFMAFSAYAMAQGMTVDSNGNVVIGSSNPVDMLSVDGMIETTSGGIKFPDGSVQITASTGGSGGGGGSYLRVAIVAQGGGNYTDPLTAMNDIATWCGTPSVVYPCLLKIMPGVYDVGTNILQMQSYVDIEGSGENVTRITGNKDNYPGVVVGADNSEIRFITVENTGGGNFAYALSMINAGARVTNVTAIASGANENVGVDCEVTSLAVFTNVTAIASGGTNALGFYIDTASPVLINVTTTASDALLNLGIDMNVTSSPTMTNVTAVALRGAKNHALHINGASSPVMTNVQIVAAGGTIENYGIYNINSSSPVITNTTVESSGANSYGVYNTNFSPYSGGTIRIDHSVIKGTTHAVYADSAYSVFVGNTRLGGSLTGSGTFKCAGVYDDNYTFYPGPVCP